MGVFVAGLLIGEAGVVQGKPGAGRGPANQIAKWKNPGREILNRGWHLSESWLQENKGSLRKLLQRLCGHGLLVPTVKKATP